MANDAFDNDQDIFNQPEETPLVTGHYGDDEIIHLEDMEHIRLRPGMYIGKLGDGASQDLSLIHI